MNTTTAIIEFLLGCEAIKFGDFTLKSGAKSPFFINLGAICSGHQINQLADFFAQAIERRFPETDIIFGPAYKGIALATATAVSCSQRFKQNIGVLYDRKESKSHGEGGIFVGAIPDANARILLIDDVMTNGQTKRDSIALLQKNFAVSDVKVMVAVDRRPAAHQGDVGFKLNSLIDINDIIDYLNQRNDERGKIIKDWYETSK